MFTKNKPRRTNFSRIGASTKNNNYIHKENTKLFSSTLKLFNSAPFKREMD